MQAISKQQILELLRDGLGEVARDRPVAPARLDMETELSALGIDSVGAMEMIAYVEDRLGILMADDGLAESGRIADLVDRIHAQVAGHG